MNSVFTFENNVRCLRRPVIIFFSFFKWNHTDHCCFICLLLYQHGGHIWIRSSWSYSKGVTLSLFFFLYFFFLMEEGTWGRWVCISFLSKAHIGQRSNLFLFENDRNNTQRKSNFLGCLPITRKVDKYFREHCFG